MWFAAVLIVVLAAGSTGAYYFVKAKLVSAARGRLDQGYSLVSTILVNSGGDIFDIMHLGESYLFRLTRDGRVEFETQAWKRSGLAAFVDAGHESPYDKWESPDREIYEVRHGEIPEYGYELVFAHTTTGVAESLKALASVLLAGIPFVLAIAVLVGYFLAARVLAPVETVTSKAREITADRLSERLPVDNPNDEIGRLTRVVNDMLNRLEGSFENLRRFTADASHELRTPLTSIRSVGEVALKGARGERDVASAREAISSMLEETDRLSRLVDNLLVLARGDSGHVDLAPERMDLTRFVDATAAELRVLAEEKGQTMSCSSEGAVSVVVDRATFRHALFNVIHNAIRYTPPGGSIAITVTDAGENATIDVADDGPGIPPEDRPHVFERFYRVDKARSRSEGGSGLGLSIARWAVEINCGSIEIIDNRPAGILCRITLPKSA
jgi:heavy metal sensor kinase